MAERKISRKVSFSSTPKPTFVIPGSEPVEEDQENPQVDEIPHFQFQQHDPHKNRFKVSNVAASTTQENSEDGSSTESEVDSSLDEDEGDDEPNRPHAGSNQTSYVSRYSKSIGQLEVLPRLDNFREQNSMNAQPRPTMDDLQHGPMMKKEQQVEVVADDEDPTKLKGKVIKFGWLEGVLMRCLLNIWGVMLFIRLSWVIGQAGVLQGILVITWANATTFITAISMSAVSTNGQIKGGGIYYMISRSLGPEFGAAIGLLFTLANSIAVALHIVGFCESVNDLLKEYDLGVIVDGGPNDTRIIGAALLCCILVLVFVGMDWVTRTQMFMLLVLIAAQVCYIVGSIIGPSDEKKLKGYVGFSMDTLKDNWSPDFGRGMGDDNREHDFFTVFGVFFPAVTGIVAGANLSGDLKDPASAIPKGTLLAISITYVSYILYGTMMGASAIRQASGNITDYIVPGTGEIVVENNVCDGRDDCKFGLLRSAQVMALISSWGPLIYMGCFAASISSAIASLVGAPRVLMALAKDKLYPKIHFFSVGYGANNDPVRGYVLVFIIALGCVLIADLNAIAPLLSTIFLAAYSLINFSCFHASITKSAGWRPAFKFYNAWVSLIGSLMCISAMFLMNWIYALITICINIMLYLYVSYRKPEANWGSSTQAQSYNSALRSTQDLIQVEDHVKNYRPQVLVLSGLPASRPALVDLGHLFIKNTSLMICGHVVKGPLFQRERNTLQKNSYAWLRKHGKKGFYSLIEADSVEEGAHSIMQTAGLGKLKPNMVLMGYKHDWNSCNSEEMNDYLHMINETLHLHLAIGILRVKGGLDYSGIIEEEGQMTVEELLMESRHGDLQAKVEEVKENGVEPEAVATHAITNTTPVDPTTETVDETEQVRKRKSRKISVSAMYHGTQPGKKPSREILNNVVQFRRKHDGKCIDVWWMYDDGGLTLLLPYLLTKRKQYAGCKLRIFSLAPGGEDALGNEQRSMATLLAKLRIDYSDVIVIPDTKESKPNEEIKQEFNEIINKFKAKGEITEDELKAHKEKTNRHLKLREHLLNYSKDSAFIAMTMLIPRKGSVSAALYMAWLEILTRGLPPFLLTRGNQSSVFTFYA